MVDECAFAPSSVSLLAFSLAGLKVWGLPPSTALKITLKFRVGLALSCRLFKINDKCAKIHAKF